MKRSRVLGILMSAAGGFMLWNASLASANTYYWDVSGPTEGIGGASLSLDWIDVHWSPSIFGNVPVVTWPNANPNTNTAVFSTSAGTVNVNAPVFVNRMMFDINNYAIVPNGSNYITLSGTTPSIDVSLPIISGQTIVTISAPITGTAGFTLSGNNNLGGGLKFLQLQNASTTSINNFSGPLTIATTGALRLGGGSLTEQIGDNTDMFVSGVMDFVTTGSGSNGKNEKVRNISVLGSSANFSVGNGAKFIVNSATISNTSTAPGLALNGNTATVQPSTLDITGWSDGNANLTLSDGTLKMNTTSGNSQLGSLVNLAGNIDSSGNSWIYNQNGGGAGTATTNTFTNHHFNFTSAAATINVASGTLTLSSAAAAQSIVIDSAAGGTTLVKTGPGDLFLANAAEDSVNFTGTNEVRDGSWTIGANERLANQSALLISGGTFRLQGFSETIDNLLLSSGTINGTGTSSLLAVSSFDLRSGWIDTRLGGVGKPLVKSTGGTVILKGSQTYTGATTVTGGTLSLLGNLASPTLTISAGTLRSESWNAPNDVRGVNRFSALSISPGATLDLQNNAMVLDYVSPGTLVNDVRQHILSGRIAYLSAPGFRLGYGDNQSLLIDSFAGKDVSTHNNVLVKYTYAGDANLDGQVDILDLYRLAQSWQSSGVWTGGDFNYDGTVNAADLGLLASEWQAGVGNPLPSGSLGEFLTTLNLPDISTPEPIAPTLLYLSAAWLLQRPRPRRRFY